MEEPPEAILAKYKQRLSTELGVKSVEALRKPLYTREYQEFKEEYGEDRVIDINGARVKFSDGWGIVRASSNLPVLTLGFEAKTKEGMEKIMEIFRKKMEKHPEIGKEWRSG